MSKSSFSKLIFLGIKCGDPDGKERVSDLVVIRVGVELFDDFDGLPKRDSMAGGIEEILEYKPLKTNFYT